MEVCRYYQLTESGFYYLQSRYYDPALGRFLNADSYASTGQGFLGYNMFAYCNNNPVVFADYDGCFIEVVIPALDGLQQLFEQVVYWGESGGRETVIEVGEGIAAVVVYVFLEDTVSDAFNSYDPDPYKRAGQKKQGRENKSHARKQSGWQPRNNRRDKKPRKPKKHTPGRDHSHYVFWILKWEDEES